MLGEHARQRDVMIAWKTEGHGAVIERQQRRHRRELGVRRPSLARLVGDVGEAEAVTGPLPQVRHDVLTVHAEIDGEILQ